MEIKEIMSKDVEVVPPDMHLNKVAQKMEQRDCGCILVAEDDRLVGVITDRDLALRCVAESHPPGKIKAENVMSKRVLYCRDTDEIEAIALNMTKNKVRRLPVLNDKKRLVGIVSLGDIAAHSADYMICGKALGHICAIPAQTIQANSNEN